MFVAYVFAVLTGIVSAGFVSSIWPLLAGRPVRFSLLLETGNLLPLEVLIVVLSGPLLLLREGALQLGRQRHVRLGFVALTGALCWSFFQGVVVLTLLYQLA